MHAEVECALTGNFDFLRDVIAADGEGTSVDHAASTNSSIVKLSGCSFFAPLFDGSRWGHHIWWHYFHRRVAGHKTRPH